MPESTTETETIRLLFVAGIPVEFHVFRCGKPGCSCRGQICNEVLYTQTTSAWNQMFEDGVPPREDDNQVLLIRVINPDCHQ